MKKRAKTNSVTISLSDEQMQALKSKAGDKTPGVFLKSVAINSLGAKKTPRKQRANPQSIATVEDIKGLVDQKRNEFREAMKEFQSQTDRSAAIMAGALVDSTLEDYLKSALSPPANDDLCKDVIQHAWHWNGPLGTFGSRIAVAFLTRFIGPESLRDLMAIKDIRNKFAHKLLEIGKRISFFHPEVSTLCNRLFCKPDGTAHVRANSAWQADTARGAYEMACFYYASVFFNIAHRTHEEATSPDYVNLVLP